jgi:hypothetical protein
MVAELRNNDDGSLRPVLFGRPEHINLADVDPDRRLRPWTIGAGVAYISEVAERNLIQQLSSKKAKDNVVSINSNAFVQSKERELLGFADVE